ncbi:FecR domain-containing protein [Bordetella genomosp. 12]|uniref:Histidine kinase n=1 Tax=Bordetella genomosp. 12 TaxID=463035 RepID=A0A261VCB9_9BORD|nr:FecR family protein [Bordetella genomosp. 12]OZI71411.1 hypothetical protein CAL22_16420 [Bordetella genomosp. 12]
MMPASPHDRLSAGSGSPSLPEKVTMQAVRWLVALQAADANEQTHRAWMQWRGECADHEMAWRHIERVGGQLRGSHAPLLSETLVRAGQKRTSRRQALKVLSISMLSATGAWTLGQTVLWQRWRADYSADVGEQRRIALPDGTDMLINSGSAVDVQFSQDERLVRLVAGEVFVSSAVDPQSVSTGRSRPLIVQTDQGRVQALGTQFAVRQLEAETAVSILEGAVAIMPVNATSGRQVFQRGEQVQFGRTAISSVTALRATDLAWSTGMLIARDMPLPAFLSELSRYRHGWLQCDPSLNELKISGIYPLRDSDRVLEMVAATHHLELRRRSKYWVLVVPRADQPSA